MVGEKSTGRRPDPLIESRVYAAAIEVYAELGWAAFTIDAVAKRAKVGKAAIYARWSTKAAVLESAIADRMPTRSEVDTGSIRGDLLALAHWLIEHSRGQIGQVISRVAIEARFFPDVLGEIRHNYDRLMIVEGRLIIGRAVDRGELSPEVSSAMIFDVLAGTIEHHLAYLPAEREALFSEHQEEYLETVVDLVLGAAAGAAARRHVPAAPSVPAAAID